MARFGLAAPAAATPEQRGLRVVRALRILRAARTVRSVSLLRLVTSLNRGMRAIGKTLGRYGIGYVLALMTIVTFAGGGGHVCLRESGGVAPGRGLRAAVWQPTAKQSGGRR